MSSSEILSDQLTSATDGEKQDNQAIKVDNVSSKQELQEKEGEETVKLKPSHSKETEHDSNKDTEPNNTTGLEPRESVTKPDVPELVEVACKMKPKKPRRVLPNSFVAVRIPSVDVRQGLEEVQAKVVEINPLLESALVSLDKLHITLMVMTLNDQMEIDKASELLNTVSKQVVDQFSLATSPLELTFKGLGTFGPNVLFAKLQEDKEKERLLQITDLIKSAFKAEKFQGIESKQLNPHLTIAKLSKLHYKQQQRLKRIGGLSSAIPWRYDSKVFGVEPVAGLELLSMKLKADNGYYHCFNKTHF